MPVITAVECGCEFARRRHVRVAVQKMADLVWIVLRDTAEREIGETLRRCGVESRGRFRSHNDQRKEHQAGAGDCFHRCSDTVAQSAGPQTCLTARVVFRQSDRMKKISSIALFVAALAICALALALDQQPAAKTEHTVYAAADLKWGPAPPSLPAGAQAAILEGDPGKAGPFTIRLRTPAGYKVPPHTHPTAEGITVISCTFASGHGPRFDAPAAQDMAASGFAIMPAGM